MLENYFTFPLEKAKKLTKYFQNFIERTKQLNELYHACSSFIRNLDQLQLPQESLLPALQTCMNRQQLYVYHLQMLNHLRKHQTYQHKNRYHLQSHLNLIKWKHEYNRHRLNSRSLSHNLYQQHQQKPFLLSLIKQVQIQHGIRLAAFPLPLCLPRPHQETMFSLPSQLHPLSQFHKHNTIHQCHQPHPHRTILLPCQCPPCRLAQCM